MKRYLFSVGIIFLLAIGSIGAFNFLVDPLLLFHYRDRGSEKLSRIDQFHNMRLYKPIHVNRIKPDAIIIGSSRSGTIRPHHPDWQGLTGYNFSMPGITIYELSRSVKHAQANRPLGRLMIGLDYQALISPEPVYRPGFKPARMAQTPSDFYSVAFIGQRIRDLQASLFSFDILEDSILALTQPAPKAREYFTDGAWKGITNRLTGRGGYIYVARNELNASEKMAFQSEDNLAIFHDLLDFCYRNNIETRLFFTPTHAFFVDLWFRMAPEQLWRSTHKKIVAMNLELAEQYNRPPFDIWGFGNEKRAIAEPIYLARHIEKAWFNDGVHYRPRMSEKIMAALWGPASDFGQKLTLDTIDDYLDRVDALSQVFMESNRQLVADMHQKIGVEN